MKNSEDFQSQNISCRIQYDLFVSSFDIAKMSYFEMMGVLRDYIVEEVLEPNSVRENGFSTRALSIVDFYVGKVSDYLRGNISDEEMNIYCDENFKNRECNDISVQDYNLFKMVHYMLFNKGRSSVERDGADFLMGFVFYDVGRFGFGACEGFRSYIQSHSLMQKFKI